MPRKYAKKSGNRKRPRRYKRRRYSRRLTSMGVPSGMPTQRTANLRYADVVSLTSTSGILNDYIFRANDIYDPNLTGTGHQPMGHDQWAALFNHYVVLGSKISVKVVNDDSSLQPASLGCYLSDGKSLAYTTSTEFIEARKGSHRLIQPNHTNTISLGAKFSCKKFFNLSDVKDNITRVGAQVNASPSDQAYYHIWYDTLTASSDTIQIQVVVDYIVSFSEPKDLTAS